MSSISSIGPVAPPIVPQSNKVASDGDAASVEAKETRTIKLDEKLNGGFVPKPATDTTASGATRTGGLSTVA